MVDRGMLAGSQPVQEWRNRILNAVLWALAVLGSVAYAAGLGGAIEAGDREIIVIDTLVFVLAWVLALWRSLPYGVRAGAAITVSYAIGAYFTARFGPFAAGPYWLFAVPLLGALLFGLGTAIALVVLVVATLAAFALLLARGALPWSGELEVHAWIVIGGSIMSLDALLSVSIAVLLGGLQREVAQRERTERMLVQSQKMEAVGRLAGGVAHDFNNILTAITSFTQFAREELQEEAPARQDLDEVLAAAHRAQGLTDQLLAFSRQRVVQPRIVRVNDVIRDIERMLRRLIGEDIVFTTRLDPDPWNVFIDPHALQQVVMNMVVNAQDAMPQGGTLTIETSNVHLEDEPMNTDGQTMISGRHVMISVSDTGTGMDRETRARLFEPFFTTKEAGKGTGLGLASAYGIIRQAGGQIYVYSELGLGTMFKVFLPRHEEGGEAEPSVPAPPRDLTGQETVLVVEDDAWVRAVATRHLRGAGYEVLEAIDGESAQSLAREWEAAIDLLVSDVVMPNMSGKELAERLTQERPEMRVLYVSGYTHDMVARRGVIGAGTELLQKPFSKHQLLEKVRQVLDGGEAHGG